MDDHSYNCGGNYSEVRKMPLTNKEYVESAGNECPNCKSVEISANHMHFDGVKAWCTCDCEKCGATWTDNYELVEFDDLLITKQKPM